MMRKAQHIFFLIILFVIVFLSHISTTTIQQNAPLLADQRLEQMLKSMNLKTPSFKDGDVIIEPSVARYQHFHESWVSLKQQTYDENSISGYRTITSYFTNHTNCNDIDVSYYNCTLNEKCVMGQEYTTECHVNVELLRQNQKWCKGDMNQVFQRHYRCNYCFQLPREFYRCQTLINCYSGTTQYKAKCVAKPNVICLGSRTFYKNRVCNFTKGKSWVRTLLLSIFLGSFGMDRIYLGYFGWAVFKMITFGGLGVWTLIDLILISVGFLSPADGSLFIDI